MVSRIILITMLLMLGACTPCDPVVVKTPVNVKVPVEVKPIPPSALLETIVFTVPVFYFPTNKDVTSALKKEDEIRLKLMINELLGRIEAWKAWATEKGHAR